MIPAVSACGGSAGLLPYQWVVVGNSGGLYTSTSTTLASWTTQTSSFGTTRIRTVASNRTSLYVAAGNSGTLATSPDGTTWTQRTSSFSTTQINFVAYGNGVWVAVGDAGKLATSTDAITWTQRTSGTANNIRSVAYGNGLWAYGADSGVLATATDPTSTWTSRTSTMTGGVAVYYAPTINIWVAGQDTGSTGAFASSTDGTTWTARNSAISVLDGGANFSSTASIIAYGTTTVNSPPVCDVQSSTDGITWTNRTPATGADKISGIAVDDTGTFAVCSDNSGAFQYSTNGTTWTAASGSVATANYGICHSSGTPSIR
jgi:hypothetical protein